ncbi:yibE/F-like family protein [Sutcliffiella cohnii]|uniref:YibE/F-like family protein n=1 Tax=Sutcliffiella cohnii TaxID=33932 RepID=A0A223KVG2_9BACI|nr:YibE/F family protein [Sutcliffiella cohnii]AST93461.1 yibE/F-like family protein [Sutcliffiella cohnii]
MNIIVNKLKKLTYIHIIFYVVLATLFLSSILFVHHNHSFYDQPIVKVMEVDLEDSTETIDMFGNEDVLYSQSIVGQVMNGEEKGRPFTFVNEYSTSGAYDQPYKVGQELFVKIERVAEDDVSLTGNVMDVKRDKHLLFVSWVFIFILLIVGRKQGLYSILTLAINAAIISYTLDVYLSRPHWNLVFIAGVSVLFFTVISFLLVNGFNEKTYAAIAATLVATFVLIVITYLVIWVSDSQGLRYEEMQFLTRNPEVIFLAGVLVGSLGAVMDVAITMSSSIFGLYEKNQQIPVEALKASGKEIGKDIMGTMTNILFFVYISGAIPTLVLYMKNDMLWGYTFTMNLSLDIARALAGGIGIVLTIPIGIYITILFINKKRVSQ